MATRILGLVLAAILLFVGVILIVFGRSVISELQGGFYAVGGVCVACAFAIFGIKSGLGSAGIGIFGIAVLGAFVLFFKILLGKG